MAPQASSSEYLPPLNACLSGETLILSWVDAYVALCDLDILHRGTLPSTYDAISRPNPQSSLQRFLTHETSKRNLIRNLEPFGKPNTDTKKAFEAATTPINVTPSDTSKELIEDSIWLSGTAGLDETESLRIVMIELQKRSETKLSKGLTTEEAVRIQDTWKSSSARGSNPLLGNSILERTVPDPADLDASTTSEDRRRKILLELFLSEKNAVLGVGKLLLQSAIHSKFGGLSWVNELSKSVATAHGLKISSEKSTDVDQKFSYTTTFVAGAVTTFQERLNKASEGCPWELVQEDGEFIKFFIAQQMTELILILQLLFIHISTATAPFSSRDVMAWYGCMADRKFFHDFEPPIGHSTISLFQLLVSSISLEILKTQAAMEQAEQLAQDLAYHKLDSGQNATFLAHIDCLQLIHKTLVDAAVTENGPSPATPALLAWSLISQALRFQKFRLDEARDELALEDSPGGRRHSSSADQFVPSVLEDFLGMIQGDAPEEEDQIEVTAHLSISKGRVFDLIPSLMPLVGSACGSRNELILESNLRLTYLNLISESTRVVQYSQELLVAALSVLHKPQSTKTENRTGAIIASIEFLEKDESLRQGLLEQALLRFPLEISPALKLSRATMVLNERTEHPQVLSYLYHMRALTLNIPKRLKPFYETVEDDNGNPRARLLDHLSLFAPLSDPKLSWRHKQRTGGEQTLEDDLTIPAATEGYLTPSNDESIVVSLEQEYSAFNYLAKLLSTASVDSDSIEAMTGLVPDLSVICEIIAIFTSTIKIHLQSEDDDKVHKLLEQARVTMGLEGDLISVITDIFEKTMQSDQLRSDNDVTIELYANCLEFLIALLPVLPNRVWSFLGRTQLLDFQSSNVNLASIILSVETILGHYDVLTSSITLADMLVENAITTLAKPETSTRALTRFGAVRSAETPTPVKSRSAVLSALLKAFTGVLESIPNWKFANPGDQLELNTSLLKIFDKILIYTYGFDLPTQEKGHLAEVLFPSARYLVDIFLSSSSNEMPILPCLNLLAFGLKLKPTTIHGVEFEMGVAQTIATLAFCTTLLRIGLLLNQTASRFEKLLFKLSPILTRLYTRLSTYQIPVLKLLTVMVEIGAVTPEEPPSLLGYLGTDTAKCFLQILSSSPHRMDDHATQSELWNFLTTVISNRQQWLSVFLLTGKTPRETLKPNKDTPQNRKSLLTLALEKLRNIPSLSDHDAVAMLKFVSATQSHVSWALTHVSDKYKACKESLIQTISNMQWDNRAAAQADKCHQLSMAAVITGILAMDIHSSKKRGQFVDPKSLFPHLHLLRNYGVESPAYNSSLHANLQKNVESKFPGCKLQRFKHTPVTGEALGSNYCYDVKLASKLLGQDKSWKPNQRDGFEGEFIRANTNLSFVEAQIMLFNSWRLLAIELSNSVPTDDQWAPALVQTAGDCFRANTESQLPEALFQRLVFLRIDFAFTLVQRLVDAKCRDPSTTSLLSIVWEAVVANVSDFDTVFASPSAEIHRALLKVLFLSLQFHISTPSPPKDPKKISSALQMTVNVAPKLLEILDKAVSKGFRSLANILHEDPSLCTPSDFVLVTAILQKILLIPSVKNMQADIASEFAMNDTSRYATTLFSWADRLAVDNHDPLYGELSILFLLELSIIPPMAEHLAVEGVLSQLNNAAIMDYLRRPNGTGPFDQPPRIFSIWSRGILPLCLNILYAVGPAIASEVANFLNQFPGQLERATLALRSGTAPIKSNPNAGRITLSTASEAHSLALISVLLDQYRIRGAADGVLASVVPPLRYWDKERVGVKEDVEGWIQGRRGLRDRITPVNEKELELLSVKGTDEISESRLEKKIVGELRGALSCLNSNLPN